jgi:hypothetical protein
MGKNPSYLPGSVWTVGAMIADKIVVTWTCRGSCGKCGTVGLQAVARKLGSDYCMVDKVTTCRTPNCGGVVEFRYSASNHSPSRPLKATRERQGK